MNTKLSLFFLYSITLFVIGILLYFAIIQPKREIRINRELPKPQSFETHWWGYGWRPWWRRYNGLPGFGEVKPLPNTQIPKPGKPIIIPNTY
jgi:hypothetical protein